MFRVVKGGLREAASAAPKIDVDAVALGNFDGVHLGHQAIVARAREVGRVAVYTFRPHPAKLLAPGGAPPLIDQYDRKIERLAALGVDAVIEEPFDAAFSALSASEFIELLTAAVPARAYVVGQNFAFGRGREGTVRLLASSVARVEVVPAVTCDDEVVSSTRIRELVASGDVARARTMLGRAFSVAGTVVRGKARGRSIGFPTANVAPDNELTPCVGVYVAVAIVNGVRQRAVVNVGVAPTFGDNALAVEAHIFDFDRDLYGERIEVLFVDRLRAERRFDHIDALRAQIAADCEAARAAPLEGVR